jgi:hypothetical protein
MDRRIKILLICFLLFGVAIPCRAQTGDGPNMVIEEKIFDFHKVDEGTLLEHEFVVRNKGNKPLIIKKVAPG